MHKFRINKYLLEKVISNRKERKAVIMFYALRTYATSGCLKYYSNHIKEIAAETGFSVSTIYRHLNYCISYGIITKEKDHLFFNSSEKACANLGYTYTPGYTWIRCQASFLEIKFRVIYYKYRLKAQHNRVVEKLKKYNDSLRPEEIEKFRLYIFENYCDNFRINEKILFNETVDIATCQLTLSNYFGTTSQHNGFYWQHKLEKLKQIIITNRCIKSQCFKDHSELKGKVFFDPVNKCKMLQLRNEVQFI